MADIFLSYSHDDVAAARQFAEAFEREGLSVWWDESLRTGDSFDAAIERALEDAKAVVVLWSSTSVQSRWVRAEATLAERNKSFVPVMIEDCKRPIMFELTHTADLSTWKGEPGNKAWQTLLSDVRRLVARPAGDSDPSPVSAQPRVAAKSVRSRLAVPAGLAVMVLAVGGVIFAVMNHGPTGLAGNPGPTVSSPTGVTSLAILPFVNMSSDKEQDYFSDGLSEELINQLAHVPELRVIGRSFSSTFKGKTDDLRHLGEVLGVNRILEGSVRKSGNRVRVTAKLINPVDGTDLWSETYERTLSDVFAIQDEIARTVAKTLQVKLGAQDLDPGGTKNVEAFDEFLAGRALLNSNVSESMQSAVPHLEHAVALDAEYIPARLWLIDAYTRLLLGKPDQRGDVARKQNAVIEQVQRLMPNSPEASLALSYRVAREGNLVALEQLLKDALRAPGGSGVRARLRYGQFLAGVGQSAAAITQLERVRQDDPLDIFARTNLILSYEGAGADDRAEAEMQQLLKFSGGVSSALLGTAVSRAQGQHDEAKLQDALRFMATADKESVKYVEKIQAWLKDPALAHRQLNQIANESDMAGDIYFVGDVLSWAAYFGDTAIALKALDVMHERHFSFETAGFVFWSPVLSGLRGDPGFKRQLRKWGIVDYWRATGNWGEFCRPVGTDDFECH